MSAPKFWTPAYVAIGSNLSTPREQVQRAFQLMAELPATRLLRRSRLYRSAPMGPQDQPEFVNAAAGLLTQLDALALLRALRGIELSMGRTPPAHRWGPRIIDLDLLLHGDSRSNTDELTLPHPRMLERNFVLFPLCDVAPDLALPGGMRVRDMAQRLGAAGLSPL